MDKTISVLKKILILFVIYLYFSCNSKVSINYEEIIIKDVNLITMEDSVVQKNMSVIIKENRIEWIGRTKDLPKTNNARVIDGKDKYLTPGLMVLSHLPKLAALEIRI